MTAVSSGRRRRVSNVAACCRINWPSGWPGAATFVEAGSRVRTSRMRAAGLLAGGRRRRADRQLGRALERKHRLRGAVREVIRDLARLQQDVERHDDRAGLENAEVGDRKPRTVGTGERNVVAGPSQARRAHRRRARPLRPAARTWCAPPERSSPRSGVSWARARRGWRGSGRWRGASCASLGRGSEFGIRAGWDSDPDRNLTSGYWLNW